MYPSMLDIMVLMLDFELHLLLDFEQNVDSGVPETMSRNFLFVAGADVDRSWFSFQKESSYL